MNTNKNTRPETAATDYRLVRKYQREAAKAGFTNPFIRKIQNADCNKTLYENRITTGNCIDGQIITLDAVRKWCGTGVYLQFCKAVENHTPFHSSRFNFRGYDGSLWVEPHDNDDSYYLSCRRSLCRLFQRIPKLSERILLPAYQRTDIYRL